MAPHSIREAVGVFSAPEALEDAISAMEMAGFGRHQLSVLGSEKSLRERFGGTQIEVTSLEDHPHAPRSPDIKLEELGLGQGVLIGGGMMTGVLAAIVMAGGNMLPGLVPMILIGTASGGAIGAILAKMLGERYAEFFQRQIDEGGLLLWVYITDETMERLALDILSRYGARHIHTHDLPASAELETEMN